MLSKAEVSRLYGISEETLYEGPWTFETAMEKESCFVDDVIKPYLEKVNAMRMRKVRFQLRGKAANGTLVRENEKTVLVSYRGKEIKRHKDKHDVEIEDSSDAAEEKE